MNRVLRRACRCFPLLGLAVSASAAGWLESSASFKAGYDTNVIAFAEHVPAAPKEDSAFFTGGASATADLGAAGLLGGGWKSGRVTLASEATRFAEMAEENFVSHRLGYVGEWAKGADAVAFDLSGTRINGSRDTYESSALANAFGTPVWRERRSQWQGRGRAQWSHLADGRGWRVTGTTTLYDMGTRVRSGCASFVDRGDSAFSAEAGLQRGPGWWWLGAQIGRQEQGTVALPGAEFDYSNDYRRLSLAWNGTLAPRLKVAIAGGPDWRHYTGRVNPSVFPDRDRQTWWLDADAGWDLSPAWKLTAKVARNRVVASTGKSAYDDRNYEMGVAWKAAKSVQWRAAIRFQQAEYFPAARKDWLAGVSTGLDWTVTPALKCGADVLWQSAWSELQPVVARDFHRTVAALRTAWAF